jgi:hypothetical protein
MESWRELQIPGQGERDSEVKMKSIPGRKENSFRESPE